MNKAHGCAALAAVGCALIIASQVWPKVAATRGDWGDAQAEEYTTAAHEVHRLSYGPHHDEGHGDHAVATPAETDAASLAAAQERFDAAQTSKERARSWRHAPQLWLKWTGVAAALCGAVGYLALREQTASE
jgi:hypothetical protein